MKTFKLKLMSAPALVLAGMLAMNPAMAEKPSWAGGDKGGKAERDDRGDKGGGKADRAERSDKGGAKADRADRGDKGGSQRGERREHFEGRHNVLVRDYYDSHYRDGRCPPGLAKKQNGCLPPGQAKKWQMGYQVPSNVIFYSVPQQLVLQIGAPPSGYRYVRVDSDILMIAIGTRMVVDAIQNLGRS